MARPFNQLPAFMANTAAQIEKGLNSVVQATAREAQRTAVLKTRVDTGKARSNWQVSLNAPTSGTIPPYAPGMRLGIGERANASQAINAAENIIGVFSGGEGTIFIVNNVNYIETLNDGRGGRPAGGMKEAAVQAGINAAKKEISRGLLKVGQRSRRRIIR